MIYVTGDLHGDWDRLRSRAFRCLKKGDTLLVCGDFGFVWTGSKAEQSVLKKISKLKYNILFVEGTHDNLDLLEQYPLEDWNGGQVRRLAPNLLWLQRGGVFTIEGKRIFAFGGGESTDLDARLADGLWWERELPSPEELAQARENLAAAGNQVDVILSHESSSRVRHFLDMDRDHDNPLSAFFDEISDKVTYSNWYFGCYHLDKRVPPYYHALFTQLEPLE